MRAIRFKGIASDGGITSIVVGVNGDRDNLIAHIQMTGLMDESAEAGWVSLGYEVLKRYKNKVLSRKEVAFQISTLAAIVNAVSVLTGEHKVKPKIKTKL